MKLPGHVNTFFLSIIKGCWSTKSVVDFFFFLMDGYEFVNSCDFRTQHLVHKKKMGRLLNMFLRSQAYTESKSDDLNV